jgi:hypothetical protein
MSTVHVPVLHKVFNELDHLGLLLDLERLDSETNASYKQRLFDVFVNRSNSTYRGLINGITRELGLSLFHAMSIRPVFADESTTLATNPAIVFEETKCYIYEDFSLGADGLNVTLDRYDLSGEAWTYGELLNAIQDTGYFVGEVTSGVSSLNKAMTIFNQKSVRRVTSEVLNKGTAVIKLDNDKLIPSSVSVSSPNLTERVSSATNIVRSGQYSIDYSLGILYTASAPVADSFIRYEYRDDDFRVMASPIIVHNLQSADFKTKMFEQILSNGQYTNGLPTGLGADLINELLSIYGISYGA